MMPNTRPIPFSPQNTRLAVKIHGFPRSENSHLPFPPLAPFLLLASLPIATNFPPPDISKMKMTDSMIQISKTKGK